MITTPNTEFFCNNGSINIEKAMEAGQEARTAAIKAFVKYAAHVIHVTQRPFRKA